MEGVVVISRPILNGNPGFLLFESGNKLQQYPLDKDLAVSFELKEPATKYCVGWYDISTHQNHICENHRTVDEKYESCFECRQKTGFNPAFYNSSDISNMQNAYNNAPHSVYISYFGNGLAKAGIMSDSRGYERLYEQGALLYVIVESCSNANDARRVEEVLIGKGLKNSITKRQKEEALSTPLNIKREINTFSTILNKLSQLKGYEVRSCLDDYFYGSYIADHITPHKLPVSGRVVGQVGRYLVVKNNDRYYGYWLTDLSGYTVRISNEVTNIESKPLQSTLF